MGKKEEEEAQAMDHGESDQEESVRQQLSSYRNCRHLHHHHKVYYILVHEFTQFTEECISM